MSRYLARRFFGRLRNRDGATMLEAALITPLLLLLTFSIIEFASGPTATLVTSFDVKASRYRNIEIYGSEATLSVPDPNTFGGPVQLRSIIAADWRELPLKKSGVPQQRGVGLADMLSATKHGRPHRASGEMALHVLEMMTAIVRSSDEGRRIEMTSTCGRPAPLRSGLALNAFD